MSFFNRILNFNQEAVRQREQRRSQRYPAGAAFPLQASLAMSGRTSEAVWDGRVTDISAHGISVLLPLTADAVRGETCSVHLSMEDQELTVPGTVANLRPQNDHAICGLELQFSDFPARKSYMQLLEAVAFGAMLVPADSRFIRQDGSGLHKEKYSGEADSELILWRQSPGGPIDSFEFRMNDYFVRGSRHAAVLEIFSQEAVQDGNKAGYSAPALHLATSAQEEIRRLYRWAVPNLTAAIPGDVRSFLAWFNS